MTLKHGLWALLAALLWGVFCGLGAWLLLPRPAPPSPPLPPPLPLAVPAEIAGKPGEWLQVKAATAAGRVCWRSLDSGLNLFDHKLLKDSRLAVVSAGQPGRYRLLAMASVDGEAVHGETVVVVGGIPPVPPGPVPPGPLPPDDPLIATLRAVYQTDTSSDKAKHAKSLAALYRQAVATVDSEQIKTAADLKTTLSKAAASLLPVEALKGVRTAIQSELTKVLPTAAATVLTASHKQAAKALFGRLAVALEEVAK